MIYVCIILLCAAAALGIVLITTLLNEKPMPRILMGLHTVVGGAGFILLTIHCIQVRFHSYYLIYSFGLFVVALITGLWLFSKYRRTSKGHKGLALVYALMAIGGLAMLFVYWGLYLPLDQ